MKVRCRLFRGAFVLIVACLVFLQGLTAYEVPLAPASVRDAYVLGQRNDQVTAGFLNPYLKQLKEEGVAGPHISEIEILTPFTQVVDDSRKNGTKGYTEEDAERGYRKRGDTIVVRISLMLPAAYPKTDREPPTPGLSEFQAQNTSLRPENFWQNFRFSVKQHDKVIATRAVHNKPIYSTPTKDLPSVLVGATVWLEYDAKDVQSEETTVEVVTPEAKTISAMFDLKKLR